jgi:hypothetical protein
MYIDQCVTVIAKVALNNLKVFGVGGGSSRGDTTKHGRLPGTRARTLPVSPREPTHPAFLRMTESVRTSRAELWRPSWDSIYPPWDLSRIVVQRARAQSRAPEAPSVASLPWTAPTTSGTSS